VSCWFHRPRVVTVEGADHFGKDAFLRCTKCGLRTEAYVECHQVTPQVRTILREEWWLGKKVQSARAALSPPGDTKGEGR